MLLLNKHLLIFVLLICYWHIVYADDTAVRYVDDLMKAYNQEEAKKRENETRQKELRKQNEEARRKKKEETRKYDETQIRSDAHIEEKERRRNSKRIEQGGTIIFRLITKGDLAGKTNWDLDIMRNEIYARHGRRFNRKDLQDYFSNQSWYSPKYLPDEFPTSLLSKSEQQNINIIMEYQQQINSK